MVCVIPRGFSPALFTRVRIAERPLRLVWRPWWTILVGILFGLSTWALRRAARIRLAGRIVTWRLVLRSLGDWPAFGYRNFWFVLVATGAKQMIATSRLEGFRHANMFHAPLKL